MANLCHSELNAEYANALAWTKKLFNALSEEALYSRPIALRQPCIFYLGHLPAFAWNQIFRGVMKRASFSESFDCLFERGIDPDDLSSLMDSKLEWPRLDQVINYGQRVEGELVGLLNSNEYFENKRLEQALQMVLEHYLMHIETFLYMLHQLPLDQILSPIESFSPHSASPCRDLPRDADSVCCIPGGTAVLGRSFNEEGFAWCNEFQRNEIEVPAFGIDQYPVTNGKFLEFVDAGGYQKEEYWSPDGWTWVQKTNRKHPQFWLYADRIWWQRNLFAILPLDLSCPVWVSKSEASAYARFKGAALPIEAQFHRAAYGSENGERDYPWGNECSAKLHGNFGLCNLDPAPIGTYPEGASCFDVQELIGNGWEWTRSVFEPFPGFRKIPAYPAYSADFFDGKHFVLKGASPATSSRLTRRSFRNWFQAHYPYMYAKFRCVYETSKGAAR